MICNMTLNGYKECNKFDGITLPGEVSTYCLSYINTSTKAIVNASDSIFVAQDKAA